MSIKTAFSIVVFVLAAGMVITLLVLWNVYIISDYHTIKELYMATYGTTEIPSAGRWTVLSIGITFLSLVLVVLSFYFVTFLRGARFKQQQKDFVNMMTHELKLPMSSIQMFAQTLRQKEPGPEDRKRFLDAILNDCARLNLLVDHLLKSQQIERGKLPVSLRRTNLRDFLRDFAEKWPRPLTVRLDGDADADAQVDPILLDLALTNLINNAEKYGKGSVPELAMDRRRLGNPHQHPGQRRPHPQEIRQEDLQAFLPHAEPRHPPPERRGAGALHRQDHRPPA